VGTPAFRAVAASGSTRRPQGSFPVPGFCAAEALTAVARQIPCVVQEGGDGTTTLSLELSEIVLGSLSLSLTDCRTEVEHALDLVATLSD
jgi:hypothetical protein